MFNPKLLELFGTSAHLRGAHSFLILYLRNRHAMYIAYMEVAAAFAAWMLPATAWQNSELRTYVPDFLAPVVCSRCSRQLGTCEGGACKIGCASCSGSGAVSNRDFVDGYQIQRLASLLQISEPLCETLIVFCLLEIYEFNSRNQTSARSTEAAES